MEYFSKMLGAEAEPLLHEEYSSAANAPSSRKDSTDGPPRSTRISISQDESAYTDFQSLAKGRVKEDATVVNKNQLATFNVGNLLI